MYAAQMKLLWEFINETKILKENILYRIGRHKQKNSLKLIWNRGCFEGGISPGQK